MAALAQGGARMLKSQVLIQTHSVPQLVHAFEVNGTKARTLGMLKTTQNQALANAFATGCGNQVELH